MAIPLRSDFDATALRAAARRTKNAAQGRRLLALAAVYDGGRRTEAAKLGGVTLQIVRDWVLKFNVHGPTGLIDRKPPGQPARLRADHRAALVAHRFVPMAVGGVPGPGGQADTEPGALRHGLSQVVGSAAPSRAGRRRHRAF